MKMLKITAQPIAGAAETGLNGAFRIEMPLGITLVFAGAPFRKASLVDNAFTVKCATEQRGRCDIAIPCVDFGVPTEAAMLAGVERAIEAAFAGQTVFAGCAGGIGRTGTFLAVVLKALQTDLPGADYVRVVRHVYLSHAVETRAQKDLIEKIDVSHIQRRIKWLWLKAVARKYRVPFFGR